MGLVGCAGRTAFAGGCRGERARVTVSTWGRGVRIIVVQPRGALSARDAISDVARPADAALCGPFRAAVRPRRTHLTRRAWIAVQICFAHCACGADQACL